MQEEREAIRKDADAMLNIDVAPPEPMKSKEAMQPEKITTKAIVLDPQDLIKTTNIGGGLDPK